ncbi:UDP-N-acetyl-D-glucosamine 6-dehydrogenase [subsurface metagenome]
MKFKLPEINCEDLTIAVIGLGYVGLPTALHFAKSGVKVIGFDIDKEKINLLNNNSLPFFDVGLESTYEDALQTNRIVFSSETDSIRDADIILVIVPTPVDDQKIPDLKYIRSAGKIIGLNMKQNSIIVLESTVYPGTTEEVLGPIIEKFSGMKNGQHFHLAYVPERYNPGDEEHTIISVNRIVGAMNHRIASFVAEIYRKIVKAEVFIAKNIKTAETAKVIENIQRDLNIALMNEISLICEKLGIDVIDVIEAASTKWNFIKYYPGAGVGGHCLPHDPYYLTMKAQELGYNPQLILAGRRLNDSMPLHVLRLIQDEFNNIHKPLKSENILILGASYKEGTDDLRSSPSKILVKELLQKQGRIEIVDPFVKGRELWGVKLHQSFERVNLSEVSCIVIMTQHSLFNLEKLKEIRQKMDKSEVILIDGRRRIDKEKIKIYYIYRGIGDGY